MGEFIVGHIPSKENVVDLLTKVLHGHKRRYLVSNICYDIHDDNKSIILDDDRMHEGKIDSIGHSMNLEGTRSMRPCIKPG